MDTLINFPLLSSLIVFPLIGALFIVFFIRGDTPQSMKNAHDLALCTSIVTALLSVLLLVNFNTSSTGYQFGEQIEWIKGWGVSYKLGIDGISLVLILLTTFLIPICLLISSKSIKERIREYVVCFLVLESLVIGSFASLDLLLFYFFFEAMLIPMYLLIGIWGGNNRIYAAYKFFLYTLTGSILFLAAIIFLFNRFGTTDIIVLTEQASHLAFTVQILLWLGMFVAFAVKVPMWPFHTWLPDAHVQAPTAASMILAGILLKLGGYGFIRFSLGFLPQASLYFAPLIFWLSIIAIIYTALVALVQKDIKKLIAYSSVSHMGVVTIGIFTYNMQGLQGAMFQMISHGVASAALFLSIGIIYDRLHTREITAFGGIAKVMPVFSLLSMICTMASVGLPGTSGFVGEFLVIVGVFKTNKLAAFLVSTTMVLGAAYMLWYFMRIYFGKIESKAVEELTDITLKEKFCMVPLVVVIIVLGLYPQSILKYTESPVRQLISHMQSSMKVDNIALMEGPQQQPMNTDGK